MARAPLAEGLKACRHDGTVHAWLPARDPEETRGRMPRSPGWPCPPILWPTADPLGPDVGACGGRTANPDCRCKPTYGGGYWTRECPLHG